jgi:Sec-independent protein secretion pathway component TatC
MVVKIVLLHRLMRVVSYFILNEKTKGMIAIVAAIAMYFTPDHIDRIIESLLGIYGIAALTLQKKE